MLYIRLYFNICFQTVLISGDYIVHAGDMGRELYCVRRGMVEVIGDDDNTVIATLGPGSYFGEVRDDFITLNFFTFTYMCAPGTQEFIILRANT